MSKIEWTEKTWNPITGCTKVTAGCKNCYAENIAKRFWRGRCFNDVEFHKERLNEPLKRKKTTMYFVNSMSDLFHENISFKQIDQIFCVMVQADWHTYQILTKRAKRMSDYFHSYNGFILSRDVWLGVSIENQAAVLNRIPSLLKAPAATRFLSIEPCLERIDLFPFIGNSTLTAGARWLLTKTDNKIDWVIVGCESGPQRRPCKIEWIENIIAQCKDANVPVFVKQISVDGKVIKDIAQFPKHLQIREYPKNKIGE